MTTAARAPIWLRLFYLIPIVGWAVRDTARHGEENLAYGLFAVFAAWGCSVMLFGYPGLIVPALILVPVIVIGLLAVTWG